MRTPESIRRDVIRMIVERRSGHLCSSLSVLDILYAVFSVLWDPNSRALNSTDLVLSKGHAAPALYSILKHFDHETRRADEPLRRLDSRFEGHPRMNFVPTCIVSTGSLGIGFAFAAGRAVGISRTGLRRGTIAVLSDGELQEGITYETMRLVGRERPEGLVIIVDVNGWQTSGPISPSNGPWEMAAVAGLEPIHVDGHNVEDLSSAIMAKCRGPKYIVASTVTCKGLTNFENGPEVYGENIDDALANCLLEER